MRSVAGLIPGIREAISSRTDAINRILTRARNALTHADRNFPDLLRQEISRQLAANPQDTDEDDELEAALEDEDEQASVPQAGRPVSRQQALVRFERALKSLAKARRTRRRARRSRKMACFSSGWVRTASQPMPRFRSLGSC